MTGEADGRWPVRRLALLLYPFVALAAAVNLFFLGLMGRAVNGPVVSPLEALILGLVVGAPAAWAAGRWARRMMDEADAQS